MEETLLNPVVLVEVLSPTTEAYVRGNKFDHYRSIPSLRDYLLVAQDRVRIEHFEKQSDSQWLLTTLSAPGESLSLKSIDVSILVAEIYVQVELPENPPLHPGGDAAQ